ncbi:ATP-binding protein [Streptomyces sp. NPDC046887]|uniref:ATP-binding protein n=1 Tax=Streptomyces sp. NPDC046887 TaxID=3155472 RepID=UPI0033FADA96
MSTSAPAPLMPPAPPVREDRPALSGDRRAPAAARRATARLLARAGWGRQRTADAVLIVSELVTNAVRHAPGPCRLTLTERAGVLDIAVADTGEELPQRWTHAGERGGFGLVLIERLGGRLTVVPALGGKTVRVRLDRRAESGGPPSGRAGERPR